MKNVVNGTNAVIAGGGYNSATGLGSAILGGVSNRVTATRAMAIGSFVTNSIAESVALGSFNRGTNDFVLNVYQTNNAPLQRAQVSLCFTNTSTVTASGLIGLFIDDDADGTFEQQDIVVGSLLGIAISSLSQIVGNIQPGGRFVFTNLSDAGGIVAIRTGSSRWIKE